MAKRCVTWLVVPHFSRERKQYLALEITVDLMEITVGN